MENKKSPFLSKTLWMNLILGIVAFIPSVKEIVTPEMLVMVFPVLNMILRLVTKDKIVLGE